MLEKLVGLALAVGLASVAMGSGKDLAGTVIGLSQVATERLTMAQIGKAVLLQNIQLNRRLTNPEFPEFLRKNIQAKGRDAALDLWGTAYYLETARWHDFVFPSAGDEFVVWSAGPDRKFRTADDEVWMNFAEPAPRTASQAASGVHGMEVLQKLLDKTKALLGMETGSKSTGGQPAGPSAPRRNAAARR